MQGLKEAALIDFLCDQTPSALATEVFRATRKGLDPTTPSTAGGRWMVRNGVAVLYTSLDKDGAIAEMSFHLSQLSPLPTKPIMLHRLRATAAKVLTIGFDDFKHLKIDRSLFGKLDYTRCQVVGDAAAFLGFDALLVPSARWNCQNLVLLQDAQRLDAWPEAEGSTEVDWKTWARDHNFIE